MSPVTHFFTGWLLAAVSPTGKPIRLTRREKILIVAAAVAPDLDGVGLVPELLTRNSSHPLMWFSQYHHSLHTLAFALVCTLVAFLIAGPFATHSRQHGPGATHPWLTASLVFVSFHLHLLCDLLGARGPDGYPVANSLSQAVFQRHATYVAWPMGAERLAELRFYRAALDCNPLVRLEIQ